MKFTKLALLVPAAFAAALMAQPPAAPPAQPAPPAAATADAPPFFLNGASLIETIDILARTLKLNYILDPKVRGGTVTINTFGQVKVSDLRPILETILRMNNLAMVQVGNFYRIVPVADSTRLPIHPQVNVKDFPDDESMLLNMIFLKYMTANEMESILQPFLGESASVKTYAPANLLMIQDNSRNMKRTMELIALFDSDQFAGERVQTYVVQNARPSELVKELDTVFKAYALSEKSSAVKFLPIDRINTIISVASNPGIFKEVQNWVAKLDVPVRAPAGAVDNYVYKLKYGRAENMGDVLSQLYGAARPASGAASQYSQAGTRSFGSGFLNSASSLGGIGGGSTAAIGTPVSSTPVVASAAPSSLTAAFGGAGTAAAGTGGAAGSTGGAGGPSTDLTGQYLGAGTDNGATRSNGLPRIIPNPYDNTLLVQATPQQWAQILKLLDQLDVPPRQVLIDAKIYELDLTGALQFGLEAFLEQKGTSDVANTRQLVGNFTNGAVNLTAGMLVGQSRQLLSALSLGEVRSKTHVISAPSIIATDSIPASINVGTTVPTLSAQAASGIQSGGNTQFAQTVTNQSTGVALQILARVNASGIVTMVIDQSVSAPQAPNASTSGSTINSPSFSQREVSTQVTVQDGDTVAIGGIILESEGVSVNGIPLLDRIPYLGALFSSTSYNKSRTELIIFLTPRVIYDTNQISEATEELRQKVKSLTKSIKDQQ
jgi:general secretion pathway protein D